MYFLDYDANLFICDTVFKIKYKSYHTHYHTILKEVKHENIPSLKYI